MMKMGVNGYTQNAQNVQNGKFQFIFSYSQICSRIEEARFLGNGQP